MEETSDEVTPEVGQGVDDSFSQEVEGVLSIESPYRVHTNLKVSSWLLPQHQG